MRTLARYQPAIDPAAWLQSMTSRSRGLAAARESNLAELGGGISWKSAIEVGYARQALLLYLRRVRAEHGQGVVLLPAEICSVVRQAVEMAGLQPRYVDGDDRYATPSARQYADAMTPDVVAVVVAPIYGYLQPDWQPLIAAIGNARLILDLAQGLTLTRGISELMPRADALLYSFGLGKGLDTGGGLLLTRDVFDVEQNGNGSRQALFTLASAVAVRFLIASGAYGAVSSRVEAASEAAKEDEGTFDPRRLQAAFHLLWRRKLSRFRSEVATARARANEIYALERVRPIAREVDIYSSADALHLRQIIRVHDAQRRDTILSALRRNGIDCAPAGEPVPAGDFPNARRFNSDAIRLPFLGRLSAGHYAKFLTRFERSI